MRRSWILLGQLHPALESRLASAGFALVDEASCSDVAWLTYRRAGDDGAEIVDISYRPAESAVRAELWRPSRLALAARTPLSDAIRLRVWPAPAGTDPIALAASIAGAVAAWVRTPTPRRPRA